MCFCEVCSLEDRNFILTGKLPPENPTFHLSRAVHMVAGALTVVYVKRLVLQIFR